MTRPAPKRTPTKRSVEEVMRPDAAGAAVWAGDAREVARAARPKAPSDEPRAEKPGVAADDPTRYGDWVKKGRAIDF
jgi:hypothetical protein